MYLKMTEKKIIEIMLKSAAHKKNDFICIILYLLSRQTVELFSFDLKANFSILKM